MEGRSRGAKDLNKDGKAGFRESGEVTPSGIRPSYDAPHRRFSKRRRVWVIDDDGKVVKVWKERDGKESPDSGLEEDEADGKGSKVAAYYEKKRKEKEEKEFQKQFGRKDVKETKELTEKGEMSTTSSKLKGEIAKMVGLKSYAKNLKKRGRKRKNKNQDGKAYEQSGKQLSSVQEGDSEYSSDDDSDDNAAGDGLTMVDELDQNKMNELQEQRERDLKNKSSAGKEGSGKGEGRESPDSGTGRDSVASDSSGHGSQSAGSAGAGTVSKGGRSDSRRRGGKGGKPDGGDDADGDVDGGAGGRGGGGDGGGSRGGDSNDKKGGRGGGPGGRGGGGGGGAGAAGGTGNGGNSGGGGNDGGSGGRYGGSSGGGGDAGGSGGRGGGGSQRAGGPSDSREAPADGRSGGPGDARGGGGVDGRGGGIVHGHPGAAQSGRGGGAGDGRGGGAGDGRGGGAGGEGHPGAAGSGRDGGAGDGRGPGGRDNVRTEAFATPAAGKAAVAGTVGKASRPGAISLLGRDDTRKSKRATDKSKAGKPSASGDIITVPPIAVANGGSSSDNGGQDSGSRSRDPSRGDALQGEGHPGLTSSKDSALTGGGKNERKGPDFASDANTIQVTPRNSADTAGSRLGLKGQDSQFARAGSQRNRFSTSQESTVSTINPNSDLDWADQFNQGLVAVETSRPPTGHQRRRGWMDQDPSPEPIPSALRDQQRAQNLARSLSDRLTDTRSVHWTERHSERDVPGTADTRRSVRWKEGALSDDSSQKMYQSVPITSNMGIRRYPESDGSEISRDSSNYSSMSRLARLHRKRKTVAPQLDEGMAQRRFPMERPADMDDLAWKRLLEELYPDKKYLDYAKASSKQTSSEVEEGFLHNKADQGLSYLKDRALFWEGQQPLVRPGTSMSIRTLTGLESRAASAAPLRSRDSSSRGPRGAREKGPI